VRFPTVFAQKEGLPGQISGLIFGSNFFIPNGTTVIAIADTTIHVTNDIIINGTIRHSMGVSIEIRAGHDIAIGGGIVAGNGLDGLMYI
jgi:hypothetical protein